MVEAAILNAEIQGDNMNTVNHHAKVFAVFLLLVALMGLIRPIQAARIVSNSVPQLLSSSPIIDDFENVSDWSNLQAEAVIVHAGVAAGRWEDHPNKANIKKIFSPPLDASGSTHVQFWAYSSVANGGSAELIFSSDSAADPTTSDYFRKTIDFDWTGWRFFAIPLTDFNTVRDPVGWDEINHVRFSSDGWGHTPLTNSVIILDAMRFSNGVYDSVQVESGYNANGSYTFDYTLHLVNNTNSTRFVTASLADANTAPFSVGFTANSVGISANNSAELTLQATISAANITPSNRLELTDFMVILSDSTGEVDGVPLQAAVPLPDRTQPDLLLNSADFSRISEWVSSYDWAFNTQEDLIEDADKWLTDFEETYFTDGWALPPDGGQWNAWYICPDGTELEHIGWDQHYCPTNGVTYSGYPYQQAVYADMHDDLAQAARVLAIAYHMTGDDHYGEQAADILLHYADEYLIYPLHDRNNEPILSPTAGGRIHAQTLDEAQWAIQIAWAFDLIAEADFLSSAEIQHIKRDLLWETATTILRNPRGTNNWQAWHNGGIGALGFASENPILIAKAINDPANGFNFQMDSSVSADGFWYEGAWGYHFYALEPLHLLAEMASRAGIDLYANTTLRSMYDAPLNMAMPDGALPAFNDDLGTISISGESAIYETVYAQYGDPLYAAGLDAYDREHEALYWGAATLPSDPPTAQNSTLFPSAGYAVLRNFETEQPVYAAIDFGPHGDSHGQYDKLGYIVYAKDTIMGIDPGRQSYASTVQDEWYVTTVAHNTVVVDEANQAAATGNLQRYLALPGLSLVTADVDEAYTDVELTRSLLVSADYIIEHTTTDASSNHQLDWVYHNQGIATANQSLTSYSGFPNSNGYQYLDNTAATTTSNAWQVNFNASTGGSGDIGHLYISDEPNTTATFTYSQNQAQSGDYSGRMQFNFSNGDGYIRYHLDPIIETDEIPTQLKLAIYGKESGHELRVRVYDASGERFYTDIGIDDFTGWRNFTVNNIVGWTHSGGNDDGVFDTPVSDIVVQISKAGTRLSNALFVDNITLSFPNSAYAETFEIVERGVNVWGLGSSGSTLVVGEGLGPDLEVPVPFVMVRRTDDDTAFTTLLEPYNPAPTITNFSSLSSSSGVLGLQVTHPTYTDEMMLVQSGPNSSNRAFGNNSCNGTYCLIRVGLDGVPQRLIMADATTIRDDGVLLVLASPRVPGIQIDYTNGGTHLDIVMSGGSDTSLEIYGPNVTSATVNGNPTSILNTGDTVRLNAVPTSIDLSAASTSTDSNSGAFALFVLALMLLLTKRLLTRGDIVRRS